MKFACSEARNATAWAMSSGRAESAERRLLRQLRQHLRRERVKHVRPDDARRDAVHADLRRARAPPRVSASGRSTPAFVQEYVTSQLAPRCPQMDETFTMQPACSCSICGSTA